MWEDYIALDNGFVLIKIIKVDYVPFDAESSRYHHTEARSAAVMDEDGSSDTSEPQSDERDRDVAEQVDTSEDETMVQTSEEVDSSSKPVIRLPKGKCYNRIYTKALMV